MLILAFDTDAQDSDSDHRTTGVQIKDALGNEYGKPRDVIGEKRMAFTSHADAAFDVCFENIITSRNASQEVHLSS